VNAVRKLVHPKAPWEASHPRPYNEYAWDIGEVRSKVVEAGGW